MYCWTRGKHQIRTGRNARGARFGVRATLFSPVGLLEYMAHGIINSFSRQSNKNGADVTPHKAHGAPARCHSHRERILALLRERGSQGVLASELYEQPHLYGRSPRNRISELRRDGFVISGKSRGASNWHYVLLHLSDSADWFEQSTGLKRPGVGIDLPLFSE
jgi:Helix-turn-helix domain